MTLQLLGGNSSRPKLFSSKILRDCVSSIIKRNVIMETSFNIENRIIETNTEVNNYNDIATNADENCSAASNNNKCDDDIDNGNNRDNIKRDAHQIPDEVTYLKDLLRNTFIKNYKETFDRELQDRLIHTQLNKKIDKNIIIAANDIAKDILETIENPDFWDFDYLFMRQQRRIKNIIMTSEELNQKK